MALRASDVGRYLIQFLIVVLQAALIVWALCLPLVWLLRDGLGPDSIETAGVSAVWKCSVQWGVPALVLAVPLFVLTRIDRRWQRGGKA